jgi:hypothetical protein
MTEREKLKLFVLYLAESEPARFKVCTPLPADIRAACAQWEREGYTAPDDVLQEVVMEMVAKMMIEVLPAGFDFSAN